MPLIYSVLPHRLPISSENRGKMSRIMTSFPQCLKYRNLAGDYHSLRTPKPDISIGICFIYRYWLLRRKAAQHPHKRDPGAGLPRASVRARRTKIDPSRFSLCSGAPVARAARNVETRHRLWHDQYAQAPPLRAVWKSRLRTHSSPPTNSVSLFITRLSPG